MGYLVDNNEVKGSVFEYFKNNSLYFYNMYSSSDDLITNINIGKISKGGFYFIHYKDDSNWMRYSPVFIVDFKKFNNIIMIMGINFNFIPIEIRESIFDKFITEKDVIEDRDLFVDYEGVYNELRKYGFEYSIVEYNINQIVSVHRIHMSILYRFLYSQHPKNKYDPNKLYSIWYVKIKDRDTRHEEMKRLLLDDVMDMSKEVSTEFNVLKDHIKRLQKSFDKYSK